MADSILNTTKQLLGLSLEDTSFDVDVLIHINSSISTLHQLGVGTTDPELVVDKDTEWSSLTEDSVLLSMVKPFIYLTTRLSFDPPGTSFLGDSITRTLAELTFRIYVQADPPLPDPLPPEEV